MSSFIELSHEAALHMFETLILHDCACILSALCVIFFYLENIHFPFHCLQRNIWFAVPCFESIMGDVQGAGLSHNQMANSLNFGTNTFNQSDHDSDSQFISYMLMLGGQWSWVWDMLRQAIQSELVRNR